MKVDPILTLAIDNCFASKRWTRPSDWMELIKGMGILFVEASADTECDPLYMGEAYTKDWIDEVKRCSERTGVRVQNLYSGHGTYATLGLAHTDERVRVRFRDQWMKAQAYTARQLDAGLGFFAHAIHDPGLQDPKEYRDVMSTLCRDLSDLARYAGDIGLAYIGLEQMYSPNQPPWTIQGAKQLVKTVFASAGHPLYLTLDVGHMNGQQYFMKPTPDQMLEWIRQKAAGEPCDRIWFGPKSAWALAKEAAHGSIEKMQAIERIQALWADFEYLFADAQDGSVYRWVQELAGYSPIIHLQQNDGKTSPHWPFSPAFNEKGIIKGEELMQNIAIAYEKEPQPGMPPLSQEIVLTLEPFLSTAANNYEEIEKIEQSVQYWRRFIPRDGMRLSEALQL